MLKSIRRVFYCCFAAILAFSCTSCGKEQKTEVAMPVSSAVNTMTTSVVAKEDEFVTLTSNYYDNLKKFLEGQKFDGLVNVTTESWANLDMKTRRHPVNYFFENLKQQGVIKPASSIIVAAYAKDGLWHVRAIEDRNFYPSELTWGTDAVASKMDVIDNETSAEKQLAVMLMYYYPNINTAALSFMCNSSGVVGDVCLNEGVLDNL